MEGCLDLLQLRGDDSNARAYLGAATGHLRVLSKWARKSTSTVNVPGFAAHVEHRGGITLPGDDVMNGELEALASRLRAADAVPPYRAKWSAASSSTVIMADVFRYQKFYESRPAPCTCKRVLDIQNPIDSQRYVTGGITNGLACSRTVGRPRVAQRRQRFVFGFLIIHHFY
ncbi:hypothetical protein T492DRAFT_1080765 [Pavlovales sp. CCMP2436]|nr:hypothetical protein T492DRAFT_1080765 [Pavlovales sp. CCMP2436]